MKNVLPTTLILSSLTLLAFTFLLPTSSSNQLAAIASTPSITFKESTLSVTEGDRLKVTIVAPATLTSTTRVKVTTKSGTAKTGTDFTPVNATVTFYKGGLKEKSITLVTKSDTAQEQAEVLTLSLSVSNRVVNTTTVTLNDKGTGGTTGPTLPASANQGNTLGGNPSFTTYSPQGLPQPMNPRCKQVPSKYTFTQNKFPPNNPSNPFYTWEDVYGAGFPLTYYTHEIGYYTFTIKALGYVSYQIQVPPVGSPISNVNNPGYMGIVTYPAGSYADRRTFVSECPWQDYYDEVIAFEGGTSPVAQEFGNALATRGVQILTDPVFLQSDLYKRWDTEGKRIEAMSRASGRCDELNGNTEDDLLDIVFDKDYFDASFTTINSRVNSLDSSTARSSYCYVKPGGTYYITTVSYDNNYHGEAMNKYSPYRTYKIFPRISSANDMFSLPYGFADNSTIGSTWTKPLEERLAVKAKVLGKRAEDIMSHPDFGKYGIFLSNYSPGTQTQVPTLKPKKYCLLGDPLRTDCWMGRYGMGIEEETDESRQQASTFRWMTLGTPSAVGQVPTCRPGTTQGGLCNNTQTYDTFCADASQSYVCQQGQQFPSGFGPN